MKMMLLYLQKYHKAHCKLAFVYDLRLSVTLKCDHHKGSIEQAIHQVEEKNSSYQSS